jgi:hypothetical protein
MAYARRSRRRTRRSVSGYRRRPRTSAAARRRPRMSAAARRRASARMKRMWRSGVFGRRVGTRRKRTTRRYVSRRRNPQSRRYHEFASKASVCRPRRRSGGHRVAGTFRRFRKEDRPCGPGLSSAAKMQRRSGGRFANPRRGRSTMSTARRRQLSAEMKRRWAAARRSGRSTISLRGLGRSRR